MSKVKRFTESICVKNLGKEEIYPNEKVDGIMETSKEENIAYLIKSLDTLDRLKDEYISRGNTKHLDDLSESEAELIHQLRELTLVKPDDEKYPHPYPYPEKESDDVMGRIRELMNELKQLLDKLKESAVDDEESDEEETEDEYPKPKEPKIEKLSKGVATRSLDY